MGYDLSGEAEYLKVHKNSLAIEMQLSFSGAVSIGLACQLGRPQRHELKRKASILSILKCWLSILYITVVDSLVAGTDQTTARLAVNCRSLMADGK
jgi:hypothetical protein